MEKQYNRMCIRKVNINDALNISDIYNYYITNTAITFETEPLTEEQMRMRITEISANFPYFVYEIKSSVVGYCYVNSWKSRCAYHNTLETTFYVHPDFVSKGIGRKLMQELIKALEKTSAHALDCRYFFTERSKYKIT